MAHGLTTRSLCLHLEMKIVHIDVLFRDDPEMMIFSLLVTMTMRMTIL